MDPQTPPVPKPRARYQRDSQRRNSTDAGLSNGVHLDTGEEAPPLPVFPTLAGVTDIIAASIPSLAGIAAFIGGSAPNPSAPPSAPPTLDNMAASISSHIPSLADTASSVANPASSAADSASTANRASSASTANPASSASTANPASSTSTANPASSASTANPASSASTASSTSTANPASSASTANPASSASTANPASSAYTANPASSASTANPASSASTANPASSASTANPASSASTANPASSAYTANPASSASTTNPASSTSTAAPVSLDSIVSSLANIPGLAGLVSDAANPNTVSMTTPSTDKPLPPAVTKTGATPTDVGALSQLVMLAVNQNSGVHIGPPEGAAGPPQEVCKRSPLTIKEESPYTTVLACWASQEEGDTDSSNEEEAGPAGPAPSGANGPMEGDAASDPPPGRLIPLRPAPPPPQPAGQSGKKEVQKPRKQKIPRAATIRVSRKKGAAVSPAPQNAVVRASWLDVWKGFRHNVLWATMDGQLMSLWKKRTDRFSEVRFHVSSITEVKKQDKRRFSIYFRKKHYDFMAHSDEVHEGWVASLLACRGQPSPAPPELHGPITLKDSRSRVYGAVWGPDLWVFPTKENFQVGVASFSVPLNLASAKPTGKHSLNLITPYKTFSLSLDSSKDLSVWLSCLSSSIQSALSSSHLAQRLWENPHNKVCGDCGSGNPEWASVNLLLLVCHACAGVHRGLGSSLSKVRSVKMDNKIWTEPLIQLFVAYGNRLANQVWAPAVPGAEQLSPGSSDEERSKFIQDKYRRGRYRRVHALTSSPAMMEQRLRQVVVGDDIEETMSLICSGAKVCQADPQSPSPILLAERAGKALQTELLRLNEYTDVPAYLPQSANSVTDSAPSGEEGEELHGKLEDDRFLFSLENDSAACDVLDLREVLSVFLTDGAFEMVTLSDQLICAADNQEDLLSHLVHILKVILPWGVSYAEVGGASAVSKVCVVEVGGASSQWEAWLLLWEDGVSVHHVQRHQQPALKMDLDAIRNHGMDPSENVITLTTADRSVALRFEEKHSCQSWFQHLEGALANQKAAPRRPLANKSPSRQSLYPVMDAGFRGVVPAAVERCISHITTFGLKVDGVYRRCGLVSKVSRLVEALMTSPNSAPLESDEQGVLDAGSALKQYVRQQLRLIPDKQQWIQAAVISDERSRFSAYRRLLRQLPDDNRATLNALFGHFYMVQVFSQVNRMSAQNLAVVLVPTLFQGLNQDLLRLTREFIIHHTLLFLTPSSSQEVQDEEITVF